MVVYRYSWIVIMAGILASLVWPLAAAFGHEPQNLSLVGMYQHERFVEVIIGGGIGWILGAVKGLSSSADWLGRYGFKPNLKFLFPVDALLFIGAGGFLGTAIFDPTSLTAALSAGVLWPIALGAVAA